jgi:hypothetical protein
MFHVISAAWARLARRIAARNAVPFEYAAWHGWEVRHVGRGTYRFRDPRFGQLATAHTALADPPVARTWAQAAAAARIRALDPGTDAPREFGRGA